jgi:hypothetical protein
MLINVFAFLSNTEKKDTLNHGNTDRKFALLSTRHKIFDINDVAVIICVNIQRLVELPQLCKLYRCFNTACIDTVVSGM